MSAVASNSGHTTSMPALGKRIDRANETKWDGDPYYTIQRKSGGYGDDMILSKTHRFLHNNS
jgi:hypothetical protein